MSLVGSFACGKGNQSLAFSVLRICKWLAPWATFDVVHYVRILQLARERKRVSAVLLIEFVRFINMRNVQFIDTNCTEIVASQIVRIYSCMDDAVTVDETRIQFIVRIEIESIKQPRLDERASATQTANWAFEWSGSSNIHRVLHCVLSLYVVGTRALFSIAPPIHVCVRAPKNVDAQFH